MWRDKCTVIGKRDGQWFAITRNDEMVKASSYLKLVNQINQIRCDVEVDGDEHWVTIQGTHVLINGQGDIVSGAEGKLNGLSYRSGTNTETFRSSYTNAQKDAHIAYRDVFAMNEKSIFQEKHLANVCAKLNKTRQEGMAEITPEKAENMIRAIGFAGTSMAYTPDTLSKYYKGPKPPITNEKGEVLATNDKGEVITHLDGSPVVLQNKNASGRFIIRNAQRKTNSESNIGDKEMWGMGKEMARELEDFISVAPKYEGNFAVSTLMSADALGKLQVGSVFNNNGITTATTDMSQAQKAVAEMMHRKAQGDPALKGVLPVTIQYEGGSSMCASIDSITKGGANGELMLSGKSNARVTDIKVNEETGAISITVKEMNSNKLNQNVGAEWQAMGVKSNEQLAVERFKGDPTRSKGKNTVLKDKDGQAMYDQGGNKMTTNSNTAYVKDKPQGMTTKQFIEQAHKEGKRVSFYDPNKVSKKSKEQIQAEKDRAGKFHAINKKMNKEE